jgi:hypothetical protein
MIVEPLSRPVTPIETLSQFKSYFNYKLQFWFNKADARVDLPQVQDQDDMLTALQRTTDVTPIQKLEIVHREFKRQLTNYQVEMKHQRKMLDQYWALLNTHSACITAAINYESWAKDRNIAQHNIDIVLRSIMNEGRE